MSSLLPVLCWNRSSCPQHDSLSHTNVPCKGLFRNSGVYKFEYVLCLIISMRQSRTRSQPHIEFFNFFSITIQIFGPDFWIWPHHEIKNCWILKLSTKQWHNLLAEFEEDLLKHQDRTSAAQDSERLPSKQRVRYPSHRGAEQRLYSTLKDTNQPLTELHFVFAQACAVIKHIKIVLLLFDPLWPPPAGLRKWWQETCRRSRGTGRRPDTAGWWHRCSQTGSAEFCVLHQG